MPEKTLEQIICDQVVRDYFTPNIKAEVILDALLTPYMEQILETYMKQKGCRIQARFLAKEMSIPDPDKGDEESGNNAGPKIDYVLAGGGTIYLVELKTTHSSEDRSQAEKYQKLCKDKGTTFGSKLGKRLLSILGRSFHIGDSSSMKDAWEKIWAKRTKFEPPAPDCDAPQTAGTYATKAQWLIRTKNWTQKDKYRSRKYLYTLGQLLDNSAQDFWDSPMELLYVTPDGTLPDSFPKIDCINLKEAVSHLTPNEEDTEGAYLRMLQKIVEEIYGRV